MSGLIVTPELVLILLFVLGFGMFIGAVGFEYLKRCLGK